MPSPPPPATRQQLTNFTSRKVTGLADALHDPIPDSLPAWMTRYLTFAVVGVRSPAVAEKIALHLDRFAHFFTERYGHDRIGTLLKRDVLAWQRTLKEQGFAPATTNNHLASLSGFTTWAHAQAPHLFPVGDPAKGISELGLPPLEPRALTESQVRSLKSLCDRLERFPSDEGPTLGGNARNRARTCLPPPPAGSHHRLYPALDGTAARGTGPARPRSDITPHPGRVARGAAGKNCPCARQGQHGTHRFLSNDARLALADYLERERSRDVAPETTALFLSATGIPARAADGRLSPRAINLVLQQIERWHDAELKDVTRHISPLKPHDLRHTFAFQLAKATGADAYELERRLGHRSQRYIQRYTNPPEEIAAAYIEAF